MWSHRINLTSRCTTKSHYLRPQIRSLSIHEYQAKDMLKEAGIGLSRERLAHTADEAAQIVNRLGKSCFLKSQVLSGGRGKGTFDTGFRGGIQMARNAEDARVLASQMLQHRLITKQSQADGLLVEKLLVSERLDYKQEYYLAITIDRATFAPVLIVSSEGGMEIEQISASAPSTLLKFPIKYTEGITSEIVSSIQQRMQLNGAATSSMGNLLEKLYDVFKAKDATLIEINPLVRSADDEFICLDAKINIDNAANKRQREVFSLRDRSQEVPEELEAEEYGLVYVRMDGDIGNVVNGAGLAMSTNDAIALYGGKSANFLDAGGQATTETMVKAFEIILRDKRVKVILVNIYGGIIRCDMIAESIIEAAAKLGPLRCPIVVRLQGTNAEEGQKMIAASTLNLSAVAEFGDAAKLAVEMASKL